MEEIYQTGFSQAPSLPLPCRLTTVHFFRPPWILLRLVPDISSIRICFMGIWLLYLEVLMKNLGHGVRMVD